MTLDDIAQTLGIEAINPRLISTAIAGSLGEAFKAKASSSRSDPMP
jgi:hypothetical protein